MKSDVTGLQLKFKSQYGNSEAKRMSAVRDLPPISGAIIWYRQVCRSMMCCVCEWGISCGYA